MLRSRFFRLSASGLVMASMLVFGLSAGHLAGQEEKPAAADKPAAEKPAPEKPAAEKPADTPALKTPDAAATEAGKVPLSQQQQILAQRYKQFEKTLLQMAEYMRKTDPDRADLLIRALARSKEERIAQQMEAIARLLEEKKEESKEAQYGDALGRQDELMGNLKQLLELLQSENRLKDLEAEKARIRDLLKDLNVVLGKEQDQRSQTERGGDMKRLADGQGKVAGDAKKLVEKIDRQDAERNASGKPGDGKSSDGKSGEPKPGEGKPGEGKDGKDGKGQDGKPGEGKENEGKPGDGKPEEGKPGEGKPGDNKPGEGKPGEGKSGENKPGEGKPGDNKIPQSKPGEGKPGDPKSGEGKPGDGKPGENKPGDAKSGEPKPGENKPGEQKPGENKPGEQKPGEQKPGEQKPGEGQPGESKPGEGKPSEGKPSKGKPSKGKPGQPGEQGKPGEPGEQSDDGDDDQKSDDEQYPKRTPGRKELEQARKEMERAIEELKKQNRDGASAKQDDAIAKLREAKEKLEEILRQLREEERELLLAALEARFQKMLALQLIVYNGTVGLDKTPKAEWNDRHFARSRELANQENEISLEAAKALELLKGEGSSIAFPEAIEQLRQDVLQVVYRLQREDVASLTQGIERDIIESLEELVEALQKEMEKAKKDKQKQQQQQQQGQPEDKALVEKLAELKMLRSLQMRINRRTKRIGQEVETADEKVDKPDLLQQLQGLSGRQAKIQKATYDLSTGKNQ